MTRAIYAGSFDPFTNGHLDVVTEASKLFDEILLTIATNSTKKRHYPENDMRDAIEFCLRQEHLNNVRAVTTNMLVAELAKVQSAKFLIRGLRNTTDYLQEESLAQANEMINPWIRTVYIRAKNSALSSSAIREFHWYGRDDIVKSHVPESIYNLITKGDIL